MDMASIHNLYKTTPIGTPETHKTPDVPVPPVEEDRSFEAIFDAAKNMLTETSDLQNNAHTELIKFALGDAENPHDLMIAEQKAALALQYTVAVRDRFVQSYQTIMNMQI